LIFWENSSSDTIQVASGSTFLCAKKLSVAGLGDRGYSAARPLGWIERGHLFATLWKRMLFCGGRKGIAALLCGKEEKKG